MSDIRVKLRTLAKQDETLRGYFGSDPDFRWFGNGRLVQGAIKRGACVRTLRVSTARDYAKRTTTSSGLLDIAQPRIQIDILSYDSEEASQAALAILGWLTTVDFSSDAQFGSPTTTPKQCPNFVLNQRQGMEYQLDPPAYVETLDVRIIEKE